MGGSVAVGGRDLIQEAPAEGRREGGWGRQEEKERENLVENCSNGGCLNGDLGACPQKPKTNNFFVCCQRRFFLRF